MYWESSYWFLTLDSEFLEETLYEQQKQLNSAISSYSWDLQTIVRPLRKAIVFAVDEMNVAHDLFQGCYASPTLLETISRGLHDLNFDQEWPLQCVPEGTFNGRLKGIVIDADIDASVALKLGGCMLKGTLNGEGGSRPILIRWQRLPRLITVYASYHIILLLHY